MTQTTLSSLKVGGKFSVTTFTGLNIGQFTVSSATKTQFSAVKADGTEMVFDRKTGAQLNASNPKYANKAVDLMDAPVINRTPKPKAVPNAKAEEVHTSQPVEEAEEIEDDEDDEFSEVEEVE